MAVYLFVGRVQLEKCREELYRSTN